MQEMEKNPTTWPFESLRIPRNQMWTENSEVEYKLFKQSSA